MPSKKAVFPICYWFSHQFTLGADILVAKNYFRMTVSLGFVTLGVGADY